MSTNKPDEETPVVQTDAESQEYGAQHGQDPRGQETGSSAPDEGSASQPPTEERTGEGTGAAAGEYS
jgi:hypothetical protein